MWNIQYTNEFGHWWEQLGGQEHESIAVEINLLEHLGPDHLVRFMTGIRDSKHNHLRELRVIFSDRIYRILFGFKLSSKEILLIGGDKTGNDRWYEKNLPLAEKIFKQHFSSSKIEEHVYG